MTSIPSLLGDLTLWNFDADLVVTSCMNLYGKRNFGAMAPYLSAVRRDFPFPSLQNKCASHSVPLSEAELISSDGKVDARSTFISTGCFSDVRVPRSLRACPPTIPNHFNSRPPQVRVAVHGEDDDRKGSFTRIV